MPKNTSPTFGCISSTLLKSETASTQKSTPRILSHVLSFMTTPPGARHHTSGEPSQRCAAGVSRAGVSRRLCSRAPLRAPLLLARPEVHGVVRSVDDRVQRLIEERPAGGRCERHAVGRPRD